jgi:hypothetical protein
MKAVCYIDCTDCTDEEQDVTPVKRPRSDDDDALCPPAPTKKARVKMTVTRHATAKLFPPPVSVRLTWVEALDRVELKLIFNDEWIM